MTRSVLTLLALACIGLAALGTTVPPRVKVAPDKSDFETFRSVVARVRVGEPYYRSMGFRAGDFPAAEAYYREAITLPLYPGLDQQAQDHVVEALARALDA